MKELDFAAICGEDLTSRVAELKAQVATTNSGRIRPIAMTSYQLLCSVVV